MPCKYVEENDLVKSKIVMMLGKVIAIMGLIPLRK